jgi:hypothetical protein
VAKAARRRVVTAERRLKLVKPEPPRSRIAEASEGIRISFPNPMSVPIRTLLSVGFFLLSVIALSGPLRNGVDLLFGSILPVTFLILLVQMWFYWERIEITDTSLMHSVGPIRWSRHRVYDLGHVRRLRPSSGFQPGVGTPGVAFDYGAKTVRLGHGIHEAEAVLLIDVIARRFPQLAPETR